LALPPVRRGRERERIRRHGDGVVTLCCLYCCSVVRLFRQPAVLYSQSSVFLLHCGDLCQYHAADEGRSHIRQEREFVIVVIIIIVVVVFVRLDNLWVAIHTYIHTYMYCCPLCYQAGFDVFNCLDLMDNEDFLKELKFGKGDGNLYYYLYNWRCRGMPSSGVGLVLL